MERGAPPDGCAWTGRQNELVELAPEHCPAGHPYRAGHIVTQPRAWMCACGQRIVRRGGKFVAG